MGSDAGIAAMVAYRKEQVERSQASSSCDCTCQCGWSSIGIQGIQ